MPFDSQVRIEGLAELERALKALPVELAKKTLTGALLSGAKIVVDDAKARVPVLTGEVGRNIRAVPTRKTNYAATVQIGVRKLKKKVLARLRRRNPNASDPFYWRFLEFGTSKMRARPFLRPAFEARKVAAAQRVSDAIRERLEAIVAQVRAKYGK